MMSPIALHGVFAPQAPCTDDRARNHEAHQIVEERPFLMDGVKALGLRLGHVNALRSHDAQAGTFELGGDRSGQVAACGVQA